MTLHCFQLHCRRIDDSQNMARYYALSLQPTLFGEVSVIRAWGRIGSGGRERIDQFATEAEAIGFFLKLARIKRARGYRPVASRPGTD